MKNFPLKKQLVHIYNYLYDYKILLLDFYNKIKLGTPNIMTIDETIDYIINNHCSISRYGDGEFCIMIGESIGFQSYSEELSNKLKDVIKSKENNLLLCVPDYFNYVTWMKKNSRNFMRMRVASYRKKWMHYIPLDKLYGNASVTRLYMDWNNKSKCESWFNKLKLIWDNQDIVFIEGEESRLGYHNDLFDNAKSVKRILCPKTNAFNSYNQIINTINKLIDKDKLLLLALGPTATVLAYDLSVLGYWAIDVGHVDIEYEWYLQKATEKVSISNKYVNEAKNGNLVYNVIDKEFINQIIARVDC